MATSSIKRNIVISEKNAANKFFKALKAAEKVPPKKVELSRKAVDIKAEELKVFLEKI